MIKAENLRKRFGKVEVLKGVDFEIGRGGTVAILGPNGSGKTTIMKTILGMVIPQSGAVYFQGKNILGQWNYRTDIAYLPQIARFPENLTVRELIRMIKDVRGVPTKEEELIQLFGLTEFLKHKLGHLSGGTRQKVNIVLAFMFDCPLVILDEPTAGLDPISLIHLKELIQRAKAKGTTFLITTHIMPLVEELADEIIFLLDGKIHFQGNIPTLKQQTGQTDLEHAIATLLKKP